MDKLHPQQCVRTFIQLIQAHTSSSIIRVLQRPKTAFVLAAIGLSFLVDAGFSSENFRTVAPAYFAVGIEALSSSLLQHTQSVLLPSLGATMATTLPIMGGFLLTLVIYLTSGLFVSQLPVCRVQIFILMLHSLDSLRITAAQVS